MIKACHPRAAAVLVSLLATGCASHQFGPRTVVPAQRGYNEALSQALDEQLLLNLVRLRYRENPLFLEISSIVAQFNRNATAGASLKLVSGGANEGGLSVGVGASESPVLTLIPLKGRDFVQRMLAPIQPESLVALGQSGWNIERVLICCIQEIARIRNAEASSPTPEVAPEFERFRELARLLREIQIAGGVDFAVEDQRALYFDFNRLAPGALTAERAAIVRLLGLPEHVNRFQLTAPRPEMRPNEVGFVGRSFYGILHLLAQAVEVPPEDEARGRVTVTRTPGGNRFD